jgi:hypothetical protein
MAGTPSKTGARLALIVVLIPIGAVLYYLSPFLFPVWRWENMSDWNALSTKLGKPVAQLQKTYKVILRNNPRGENDPTPWQILSSEPAFDPENEAPNHMVRCTLISERTGTPPSSLRLGSNYRDSFFTGTVWWFPPGAFGFNKARPVLVYDGWAFDKLSSNEAFQWDGEMKDSQKWTNDDTEIDDGYVVPGSAPAQ